MGSKVTDAILNDKFKIKWFLLLSLNLEVESYSSKFIFTPLKLQTSSSIPFPWSSFPPQLKTFRVLRRAMSSKSIPKGKKERVLSFKKQTLLKGTLSQQKNFSVSKSLLLSKASKGPWAKTSTCTSTNLPPFKPKGGFPVFKNLEQLWFSSATTLKYKHTHTRVHTHACSVERINSIQVSAKMIYSWK